MADQNKKVLVVTGASAGLGKSLSLEVGKRRFRVVLLARSTQKLSKVAEQVQTNGGEALVIPTDVTKPDEVKRAFAEAVQKWNQIDILFNAAGVVQPVKPMVKVSDKEYFSSLLINVYGIYISTREAVKQMIQQDKGGTVVNVSSGAAIKPYFGWSAYGSQKAAVDMFTRIVAQEVAGKPIRIFGLSPGPFKSGMQEILRNTSPEDFPSRNKFIKLYEEDKLASPEDLSKVFIDLALSNWPELNGRIEDIRDAQFKKECEEHGIEIG